jgi:hypothetical protein
MLGRMSPAHALPQVFFAYAPYDVGLRCALFYVATGDDLWGWFTGPQSGRLVADYFQLADFHSPREPRYVAVDVAGLHSGWTKDAAMCDELERLRDDFARDWLLYRSTAGAAARLVPYERAGLRTHELNLRFDRLGKLTRMHPDWIYCTAAFEPAAVTSLARYWPLDYRPNGPFLEPKPRLRAA